MTLPNVMSAGPAWLVGGVRHTRLRPVAHAFRYPTAMMWLPMRALRDAGPGPLNRNSRWAPMAFVDCDHGDGRPDALHWLEEVLHAQGVHAAQGEVWLLTYPRQWGHTFKPVSFWFCLRRDGQLAAILVEVNNTFGERHVYLLDGADVAWGKELRASKVLHVSPFCQVQGEYRFRFMHSGDRLVARVALHDSQAAVIVTSISGSLRPMSRATTAALVARMPLLMAAVVARIHWQALRLAMRRLPIFRKPEPPTALVSRS